MGEKNKGKIRKKQRSGGSYSKHTLILITLLSIIFALQFIILDGDVDDYITHTQDIFDGTYHTVITSLFLHMNLMHLISNLIGLFLFGRIVEKHFGKYIYFVFLFGGIIANVVSNSIAHFLGQEFYSLGASSGIASIIILGILLEPFKLTTILGWGLIAFDIWGLFQPDSPTNHLAHLGGYTALVIIYFFVEKSKKQKIKKGFLINVLLLLALILLVLFLAVTEVIPILNS